MKKKSGRKNKTKRKSDFWRIKFGNLRGRIFKPKTWKFRNIIIRNSNNGPVMLRDVINNDCSSIMH